MKHLYLITYFNLEQEEEIEEVYAYSEKQAVYLSSCRSEDFIISVELCVRRAIAGG